MRVLDAAAVLCDATTCDVRRDGEILDADRGHLSLSGARLVAARVLGALRDDQ